MFQLDFFFGCFKINYSPSYSYGVDFKIFCTFFADTFDAKQEPPTFHHDGIVNFLERIAYETVHSYNCAGTRLRLWRSIS